MIKKILAVLACAMLVFALAIPCFATGYGNPDTYYVSPVYTPTVLTYSTDLSQTLGVDLPLTVPADSTQNNTNNAWIAVYDDNSAKRFTILCRNRLTDDKSTLTTTIPAVESASPSNLLVGNSFTLKYEGIAVDPASPYDSVARVYINAMSAPTLYVTMEYTYKSADTGELFTREWNNGSGVRLTPKQDADGSRYLEFSLRSTIRGLQSGGDAPIYINNFYATIADTSLSYNCSRIVLANSVDIGGNSVAQNSWDNELNVNYDSIEYSFTDWIGTAVGSFFDTPLFVIAGIPISLGVLFAVVIVLGVGIMIIRAFAGG